MWKTLQFRFFRTHLLKWLFVFLILALATALIYYFFFSSRANLSKNTFNATPVIDSLFTNYEEQTSTYAAAIISEIGSNYIIVELLDKRSNKIQVFVDQETKFQIVKEEAGTKVFVSDSTINLKSLKNSQRISLVLAKNDSKLLAKEINIEEEKK